MEAVNMTDEAVEARVTMTVMLEPGEGLREALERAVEDGCALYLDGEQIPEGLVETIADEVGQLFGLEPEESAS